MKVQIKVIQNDSKKKKKESATGSMKVMFQSLSDTKTSSSVVVYAAPGSDSYCKIITTELSEPRSSDCSKTVTTGREKREGQSGQPRW